MLTDTLLQIFHITPTPPTLTSSTSTPSKWSANLINVLNHGDPSYPTQAAPITCILPMPHNVYTGDEDGRVVRSSFLALDIECLLTFLQYEWDCVHRHH